MRRQYLAIGIILLFVGICIIPVMAQNTEEPHPVSRGTWLYVGGSGPGNYTRIQDAIDNASDGDTVFVYDDLSPYIEQIQIEKSITLVGEEIHSTIIEFYSSKIIHIMASKVTVSNFTIQHSNDTGISIYSEDDSLITDIVIADNIINDTSGVSVYKANVIITRNIIENGSLRRGISISSSSARIEQNIISDCWVGIDIWTHKMTLIANNDIRGASSTGINMYHSSRVIIRNNNIQDNLYGIFSFFVQLIFVKENNFINNFYNADFQNMWFTYWTRNYWDNWDGTGPYAIPGPQSLWGIPWRVFDWHPAQEPNDITRMI
jgi:parallel beta-helix repeat protein